MNLKDIKKEMEKKLLTITILMKTEIYMLCRVQFRKQLG